MREIDSDDIAVLQRGDRAAHTRFGRYMTYHQPVRGAGKAAVCDESNISGEASTDYSGSDAQHFPHSWAGTGPFVPDDDHVTRLYRARLNGRESVLFRVEHPGRALVIEARGGENLGDVSW